MQGLCKISLPLVYLMGLAMLHPSYAHEYKTQDQYTNAHYEARSEEGSMASQDTVHPSYDTQSNTHQYAARSEEGSMESQDLFQPSYDTQSNTHQYAARSEEGSMESQDLFHPSFASQSNTHHHATAGGAAKVGIGNVQWKWESSVHASGGATSDDDGPNSPQAYIDAHNAARAEVGVGPMTWNDTVAEYAKNYARKLTGDCDLVHSDGPYGENLAMRSADLTAVEAVKMWVDEKPNYDYNSDSCTEGMCRHYTQVVWRDSVRLGCAKVQCNNNAGTIISCNYDPPGNYIGVRGF